MSTRSPSPEEEQRAHRHDMVVRMCQMRFWRHVRGRRWLRAAAARRLLR